MNSLQTQFVEQSAQVLEQDQTLQQTLIELEVELSNDDEFLSSLQTQVSSEQQANLDLANQLKSIETQTKSYSEIDA